MSQNTLQNNQIELTFTEFSNLQSTVQPEHPSPNINYNDVNVNPSDNIFPSPQHPIGPQQQTVENIPPLGSFNMTGINPSQSEILSFDIPGFKIIVIPTFSPQDNTYLNYSSNITNTQFQ
ncbi:hypothetical protein RhiirA4_478941 [Rhizophagus irregularis]|uniref:Uncharacterized protein n=1 Tax=Rhizophagus irregularis TaxID=588596 RepID=A0A2I1HFQ5_9GLOM|nr:hypothetical protein RhiirA4_478941 [Rhizophagus irregularis]